MKDQRGEGRAAPSLSPDAPRPVPRALRTARRGFDIHASVSVSAADRDGRERLLRYCVRAPLSLERLAVLDDGRVAYAIKNPRGKQTHRVMTPVQFLARLCALIPPPRHPLIRFFGVFAPHSSWRAEVVELVHPLEPAGGGREGSDPVAEPATSPARANSANADRLLRPVADQPPPPADPRQNALPANEWEYGSEREHEHGIDFASRLDWATLLKRVHDVDALACPCGGRLRFIALIVDPEAASALLSSLGFPADPPPIARARSPDCVDPVPAF